MKNRFLVISFSIITLLLLAAIVYLIAGLVVSFPAPFLVTAGLSLTAALLLPLIGSIYCKKG
jgi:hypothetical protein